MIKFLRRELQAILFNFEVSIWPTLILISTIFFGAIHLIALIVILATPQILPFTILFAALIGWIKIILAPRELPSSSHRSE